MLSNRGQNATDINFDDDNVFESNEQNPLASSSRRQALDPSALKDIAIAHQRYKSHQLQGYAVAPKSSPIWMQTLPSSQHPRSDYTAAGDDALPTVSGSVTEKKTAANEREERVPCNVAFVRKWLTKRNMSLFLFREENMIRSAAVEVVNSRPFEYLVIAAIIANVIVMCLSHNLPKADQSPITKLQEKTELIFVIFFTIEAGFKIIADGFILNRGSYLRNFWNVLDFIVVISGLMTVLLPAIDLSFLRTLRILRPLKLLTRVRSLRVILQAILTAMVPLLQIMVILLFVMALFAIVGMQFYVGIFHRGCVSKVTGEMEKDPIPCAPDGTPPGPSINVCPENFSCQYYWLGPNEGITSFDNFGYALLTVFQSVSTEGWTEIMYTCDLVYGTSFNWVYYCSLVVIGTFFMLNLVLGVLSAEFAKERGRVEKRRQYLRQHRQEIFFRELGSYLNWIIEAENSILNDPSVDVDVKMRVIIARKENEERLKHKSFKMVLTTGTVSLTSLAGQGQGIMSESSDDVFNEDNEREDESSRKRLRRSSIPDGASPIDRLRRKLKVFIRSQAFFWIVIVFVVINAVTLGLVHYNQPTWLDTALFNIAIILAAVFCLEIFIKMFALGIGVFFMSKQNIFETIIILGSVLELILQTINPKWSVGIAVLRCFRLLRIFKLTRYWPELKQFIVSVNGSLQSIGSLLVFLFLFLIIFALVGMELFGGFYNFDEGRPAFHFDTFSSALITVFHVTTGEDWNVRMYDGVKAKGGIASGGIFFSIYFIVIMVLGNFTLLNLFLAIAVDSIAANEDIEVSEVDVGLKRSSMSEDMSEISDDARSSEYSDDDEDGENGEDGEDEVGSSLAAERHRNKGKYESDLITMPPASSFFVFSYENIFRRICFVIVSDPLFDYFILATIAASTVALAAENPVDEKAYGNIALGIFDYGFTAIFTLEMLLKLVVLGFFAHPGSYIRDPWNVIDAIVVVSAFVGFLMLGLGLGGSSATAVKSLRIIRVLRPLKTVRRIKKLQAVLSCILASLKKVISVLIMFALFDYIFSCLGIQLFAGKFFFCSDRSKETEPECHGQYYIYDKNLNVTKLGTREWAKWDFNYDNLLTAMMTLFVVTTGEGWPGIMLQSIETTAVNRGPRPGHSEAMSAFYIIYLIICPFFLVNVFVAMIVVTFQEQGQDKEIDKNEKSCIDYVINARPINMHLPPAEMKFRRRMWYFVESSAFETFIIGFVFLTTITMMLKHFDQHLVFSEFESVVNVAGTMVFSVEAGLRIYAYGVRGYFTDIWNAFDFFTCVASIIDVVISEVDPNLLDIGFLRLFRTVRIIKVMRKIRSIRIILWTFLQAFKALPYVVLLMAMAYFAYAVIGMQLFGTIKSDPEAAINEHANFESFFPALLLLFRVSTGEGWPEVMMACTGNKPCTPYASIDSCGSDIASYIYFVSFVLLSTFLLLNLFVAVIMDNFEFLTRDSSILGPHHLDEFVRHWATYDPNGTGLISFQEMFALVKDMEPPLGFGKNCPTKTAYRKLIRMNIPLVEGKRVRFTTTLFALVRESLKIRVGEVKHMDALDKDLRSVIMKFWPKFAKRKMHLVVPPEEALGFQQLTTGKIYAGLLLLDLWKNGLEDQANKRADGDNSVQNLLSVASRVAMASILRKPEKDLNTADSGNNSKAQQKIRFVDNEPNEPGLFSPPPSNPETSISDIPSTSATPLSASSPQEAPLPVRLFNNVLEMLPINLSIKPQKHSNENDTHDEDKRPRVPYV